MKHLMNISFVAIMTVAFSMLFVSCSNDEETDLPPVPVPEYVDCFVKIVDSEGNNILKYWKAGDVPQSLTCIRKDGMPYRTIRAFDEAESARLEHPYSSQYPPFLTNTGVPDKYFSVENDVMLFFGTYGYTDGEIVFEWADGSMDKITIEYDRSKSVESRYKVSLNGIVIPKIGEFPEIEYLVTIVKK